MNSLATGVSLELNISVIEDVSWLCPAKDAQQPSRVGCSIKGIYFDLQ